MAAKTKEVKGNGLSKDVLDIFNTIKESNPYATFLEDSTLSSIDGYIDTGSMVLNAIVSGSLYGGFPMGRVTQLAGPSMSYKTNFILQALANAQKAGLVAVIFDTEGAINKETAKDFGLDISKVLYYTCESIENTRNEIYKFLKMVRDKKLLGQFVIGLDSLGNLQSELEIARMDKESTSADMGTRARATKSLMTTLVNMCTMTKTTALVSNHVYDDPSAMYPSLEKNMPGGKSVVYLPSVTVQLARKLVKDDDGKTLDSKLAASQKNYSGVVIRALTVKNRLIKQYLEGEMYLSFSKGLNKYYGLLEIMKGMGVVVSSGATYTDWNGNKLGYYGTFKKDIPLWKDTLIPELESRIKDNWCYGNEREKEDEDEIPTEDEDAELVDYNDGDGSDVLEV